MRWLVRRLGRRLLLTQCLVRRPDLSARSLNGRLECRGLEPKIVIRRGVAAERRSEALCSGPPPGRCREIQGGLETVASEEAGQERSGLVETPESPHQIPELVQESLLARPERADPLGLPGTFERFTES